MKIFDRKICFWCRKNKFLFLFSDNNMKYKIASDKNKKLECRMCTVKRIVRENGHVIQFNHTTKRFHLVHIKPTLINLIKQYFK